MIHASVTQQIEALDRRLFRAKSHVEAERKAMAGKLDIVMAAATEARKCQERIDRAEREYRSILDELERMGQGAPLQSPPDCKNVA